MSSLIDKHRAIFIIGQAHKFIAENNISWFPVNSFEIITNNDNWRLKYLSEVAEITNQTPQDVIKAIQSKDGISMYTGNGNYNIILNDDESIDIRRIRWTAMHEIGHIYLRHLNEERTRVTPELYSTEEYQKMELEADIFAAEVLASKWLLRYFGLKNEDDIALICEITDADALKRYKKVASEYSYEPINVLWTTKQFAEFSKEITFCCDNTHERRHLGTHNNPADKLQKAMPKFLRKEGTCPYCSCNYVNDSNTNFCPYCGSKLKTIMEQMNCCESAGESDAAFCKICGNRVIKIKQGFIFEECEIDKN